LAKFPIFLLNNSQSSLHTGSSQYFQVVTQVRRYISELCSVRWGVS